MIITTAFGHLFLSLFLLGQIEHFLNWHLIEYDFFHNQAHFVLFILVAACADIIFWRAHWVLNEVSISPKNFIGEFVAQYSRHKKFLLLLGKN